MAFFPGESTRMGFYIYDDNRQASTNPDIMKHIERARSISGVMDESTHSLTREKKNKTVYTPQVLAENVSFHLDLHFPMFSSPYGCP